MNTLFSVAGPFQVPVYQGKANRTIREEEGGRFWEKHGSVGKKRGCYVFGIRAGKGLTPGYVGKATRSFEGEVFTPHKLSKYQKMLCDCRKGTPILFFLLAPSKKGKLNARHVGQLEDFLIQNAAIANEDLLNVRGTKQQEWAIAGVLRGKGKPSRSARAFRKMMKLRNKAV